MSSGELELDDAVSSWWDGFIRYGKRAITVQQLLTHRAGLHRALPADLTLSRLADYSEMVRIVEDAAPASPPGASGRYAYLTYGWAVSELVRCVSGMSIDAFVQERLLEPLGLKGEIFIRVPQQSEQSVSADRAPQTSAGAAGDSNKSIPIVKATGALSSPKVRQRSTDSMRMVSSSQQALHVSSTLELRHSSLSKERGLSPLSDKMAAAALSGTNTAAANSGCSRSKTLESLSSSQDVLSTTHAGNGADGGSQQHLASDRRHSFLLSGPQISLRDGHDAAYCGEARGRSNARSNLTSSASSRGPQLVSTQKMEEPSSDRESSRDRSVLSPSLEHRVAPSDPSASWRHLEADDGASDRSKCSSSSKCSAPLQGSSQSAEKGQLSVFPKEVEIVTADTPLLWRLTSARRKISFNPMTQQEVLQRLKQTQGKLEGANSQAGGGIPSSGDNETRRHIASAMRRRRRQLINMKGNSGPLEHVREVQMCNARSAESLPDVFLRTRAVRQVEEDQQKSEEEGGLSQSDAFTEGLRTPDSDSDNPSIAPKAPGTAPRVSVLELIRTKPHVMDPLIYDSHRIVHQLIPPSNCRCTARALARFYAALGEGQIISKPLLDAARVAHTVDPTLEALLLTGGGSRTWGLGYQLYDCVYLSPPGWSGIRPGQGTHTGAALLHSRISSVGDFVPRRNRRSRDNSIFAFSGAGSGPGQHTDVEALLRDRGLSSSHPWGATLGIKPGGVVGLGHGDVGGSVAVCFPEMNLSISILLNDVLTGPEVRNMIFKCAFIVFVLLAELFSCPRNSLPQTQSSCWLSGLSGEFGIKVCFDLGVCCASLQASQIILEFLLRCFGLQPKWQTHVSINEVLENLTPLPTQSQ